MLLDLAARPEYAQPMREEVQAVINEEGWTKVAVGKLWKLDSFLKESQRLSAGLCMFSDSFETGVLCLLSAEKFPCRAKY